MQALCEHLEALFHYKGGRALAQVIQGGCGVSICGDIQKLSVVLDYRLYMALHGWGGLDKIVSRHLFQPQPFCISVIP